MGIFLYGLTIAGFLLTVVVFGLLLRKAGALEADRELQDLERPGDLSDLPTVTVIVPARNEEAMIGPCLRSIFAFDYPSFDVILADDASTDDTADVARRVIEEEGAGDRVRIFQPDPSPEAREGWMSGKSFVLWQASRKATGELLLFIDADTVQRPDGLWRAVTYMERHDLPAFSASGVYPNPGFFGDLLEGYFYLPVFLAIPLRRVHDPDDPVGWMNGQFILIDRETYERVDGHRAIRDYSFDDMSMAAHLKAESVPFRFLPAAQLFQCTNYEGLGEAFRGWVRLVAGGTPWLGLGAGYFLTSTTLILLTSLLPFVTLGLAAGGLAEATVPFGPSLVTVAAAQSLFVTTFVGLYRGSAGLSVWPALLTPISALLSLAVFGKGAWTRYVTGTFKFGGRLVQADSARTEG